MAAEMDYEDANGETLTSSRRITLYPSAVRLGLKTDGWLMRDNDLRLNFIALDLDGKPIKGQRVQVALYNREIITARRRSEEHTSELQQPTRISYLVLCSKNKKI